MKGIPMTTSKPMRRACWPAACDLKSDGADRHHQAVWQGPQAQWMLRLSLQVEGAWLAVAVIDGCLCSGRRLCWVRVDQATVTAGRVWG